MKGVDIIAQFELEINKIDDIDKPNTDDSLFWINQAIFKFVKERFNGNAPKRTSYEQNEKRARDLIHLYSEDVKTSFNLNTESLYDVYEIEYPEDLMFVLNEDVVISDTNGQHVMPTCVFECTADNFMYRINNSLTDFHYRHHRARPIRIRINNGIRLLTDKNYNVSKYTIGYLKRPKEITSENPNYNYTDFDDYIWAEIIKIAAQMYIENKQDPRYNTISNEVLTME